MRKTLSLRFSVLMLALALSVVSCKKDSEPDDPNIIYTSFNKTFNTTSGGGAAVTDSLDFNLDTRKDFAIVSGKNLAGDTAAAYLIGNASGGYIDSTQHISSAYQAAPLSVGQTPNKVGTAKQWKPFVILAIKAGPTILGFAGAGDQYIPIVISNPATMKPHYGWVRVNISSDYDTFKVIDGAYNLIPETPIAMGAK